MKITRLLLILLTPIYGVSCTNSSNCENKKPISDKNPTNSKISQRKEKSRNKNEFFALDVREKQILKNQTLLPSYGSENNHATCWIESVSFRDLNSDSLTDIIVIGKCGANSGNI